MIGRRQPQPALLEGRRLLDHAPVLDPDALHDLSFVGLGLPVAHPQLVHARAQGIVRRSIRRRTFPDHVLPAPLLVVPARHPGHQIRPAVMIGRRQPQQALLEIRLLLDHGPVLDFDALHDLSLVSLGFPVAHSQLVHARCQRILRPTVPRRLFPDHVVPASLLLVPPRHPRHHVRPSVVILRRQAQHALLEVRGLLRSRRGQPRQHPSPDHHPTQRSHPSHGSLLPRQLLRTGRRAAPRRNHDASPGSAAVWIAPGLAPPRRPVHAFVASAPTEGSVPLIDTCLPHPNAPPATLLGAMASTPRPAPPFPAPCPASRDAARNGPTR